jgi:hypothetical protein
MDWVENLLKLADSEGVIGDAFANFKPPIDWTYWTPQGLPCRLRMTRLGGGVFGVVYEVRKISMPGVDIRQL